MQTVQGKMVWMYWHFQFFSFWDHKDKVYYLTFLDHKQKPNMKLLLSDEAEAKAKSFTFWNHEAEASA